MTAREKYHQRVEASNSLLCVGLDSDYHQLPPHLLATQFPQFEFNKAIIDATHHSVCAYKPNVAFYEARGEQGIHELKLTMEYLHAQYPDVFTIADAKRADIGSTNAGYVESIFDWFGFDAITLHPYLGKEALQPFLERTDKVSIILCRTSNPGAGEFQDLEVGGQPLWAQVAEQVATKWNTAQNCMLVVGATYPQEMKQIRQIVGPDLVFLVPGVGQQGGSVVEVMKNGATAPGRGVIISEGRSIIFATNTPNFAVKAGELAQKRKDEIQACIP